MWKSAIKCDKLFRIGISIVEIHARSKVFHGGLTGYAKMVSHSSLPFSQFSHSSHSSYTILTVLTVLYYTLYSTIRSTILSTTRIRSGAYSRSLNADLINSMSSSQSKKILSSVFHHVIVCCVHKLHSVSTTVCLSVLDSLSSSNMCIAVYSPLELPQASLLYSHSTTLSSADSIVSSTIQ